MRHSAGFSFRPPTHFAGSPPSTRSTYVPNWPHEIVSSSFASVQCECAGYLARGSCGAAARRRRVGSSDYPARRRGGAATPCLGMSASAAKTRAGPALVAREVVEAVAAELDLEAAVRVVERPGRAAAVRREELRLRRRERPDAAHAAPVVGAWVEIKDRRRGYNVDGSWAKTFATCPTIPLFLCGG